MPWNTTWDLLNKEKKTNYLAVSSIDCIYSLSWLCMFLSAVVHSGESGKNTTLILVFAILVPIILLVAGLVLWLYLQRYEKTFWIFEDV